MISYWNWDFAGQPFSEVFAIWKGGLVFYGGLIVATLAGLWRLLPTQATRLDPLQDCLAPGVVVGHAFGRMGCLPQWMLFRSVHHRSVGGPFISPAGPRDSWRAGPSDSNLRSRPEPDLFRPPDGHSSPKILFLGRCSASIWWGYAVLRSTVEAFRGDYESLIPGSTAFLTPGQRTSVLILSGGIVLYLWLKAKAT